MKTLIFHVLVGAKGVGKKCEIFVVEGGIKKVEGK
jgi:hypothetical protein